MIAHKKKFTLGLVMLIAFFAVLALFFTPIFGGLNGLDYLDSLYNSISKGSAYYIPKLKDEAKTFSGLNVELSVAMANPTQAQQTSRLLTKTGATVSVTDATLKASGDLGKILDGVLADADAMYKNDGKAVADKYGFGERQALYTWWQAFKAIEKDLNSQKKFKEAKAVANISIMDRLGVVVFSLVFYVIYTLWYGFAIMFMFEGWGMQLEH
jgi:hypothetical protein